MAESTTAPAAAAEKPTTTRPTKPDENVFKEELAKAEKDHKSSMDKLVWPRFSISPTLLYLVVILRHPDLSNIDFLAYTCGIMPQYVLPSIPLTSSSPGRHQVQD